MHAADFAARLQQLTGLIERGNPDKARKLAGELVHRYRDDPDAQYALAAVHASLQQIDEVIACCRRVTELQPGHTGARYNLGIGLLQKGRIEEAAACFEQCLKDDPGNPAAAAGLGQVLGRQGHHQEALKFLEMAVNSGQKSAETLYFYAVQLQSLGRLQEASAAYRQSLRIRPGFFEAGNNLGHILSELGDLNGALAIFESLSAERPDSAEIQNNIGVVYDSLGRVEEAEAAYRRAIELNPALSDTRSHLGFLLAKEGRTQEALACFDANLALTPDHQSSIAGKASALERTGRIEEALATLEPVLPESTMNPDVVLAYCTIMQRLNRTKDAIDQAERLLSAGGIPPKGFVDLQFALGRLYEENGDFATAFRHFAEANRQSPHNYVHEGHVRYISGIITATGHAAMARLPRNRKTHRDITFIVGMPRSGTSLVEQILSSHPAVSGMGELRYLNDIATSFAPPAARGLKYPDGLSRLSAADIEILANRYLDPVQAIAGDAPRVTDKMPHNFLFLGLANILFPGARVIHVTRTPLDNCLSLFFQSFNPAHSYSTDLQLLGSYYREYQRLMDHWKKVLDIPVLDVQYEEIVGDLESSTRRMLDFCALDWSDRCIDFHRNERFVKTPSYNQVRQPIYTGSVNRWMNYREFIAPLEAALNRNPDGHIPHAGNGGNSHESRT